MKTLNGVAKVAMLSVLGGAVALAVPHKAEAQSFEVGVQFGNPGYANGYDYAGRQAYYEHERWERERAEAFRREQAFERQQAWAAHERHEAWERDRFYGRGDDRDFDHEGYRGAYRR